MVLRKKALNAAIESISKLIDMQYESSNGELNNIHQRLVKGRKEFGQAVTKTIDAAIQVSAMDVTLEKNIEVVEKVNTSLSDEINAISQSSESTAHIASEVSRAHESLTETMTELSGESNKIMNDIRSCEDNLTSITGLSTSAISTAKAMKRDIYVLLDIIQDMNEAIDAINSISSQTNLLALNASIEALRAKRLVCEEIELIASIASFIS